MGTAALKIFSTTKNRITIMTVDELQNHITCFHDEAGTPIVVQLDLRNEVVKDFYARMMEDLEDTLDGIEALKEENEKRYSMKEIEEEMLLTSLTE